MTVSKCDVVIIGAGPYGLAAAAHLRAAGVDTCVFGQAMEFWERQMPVGMFLRSGYEAAHIADPHKALTLDKYKAASGIEIPTLVPLDIYTNYGQWFQRQVAPDLDRRRVQQVERASGGFRLTLEDGEPLQARRVVVATGIAQFASRPPEFRDAPPELVSHSSEQRDLNVFADKQVVVIGGGQSALESAALLHEAGAQVEVIMRAPEVYWLRIEPTTAVRRALAKLLMPRSDVGPFWLRWIVALPELFRQLPGRLQEPIAQRAIKPAGAGWLWPRLQDVPITTGRIVASALPSGERLRLRLDDGSERCVDHALLATGYRVDISRYSFLAPELARAVRVTGGYPRLRDGLESSVRGLHFLGAPAARTFGPLMRFVIGTEYTAPALTRRVLGRRPVYT